MAFLLMGLTFFPCADTYLPRADQTIVAEAGTIDNHVGDDCSPLCACQCCQIQITEFDEMPAWRSLRGEIHKGYFAYLPPIGSEIHHSLLQPPRV